MFKKISLVLVGVMVFSQTALALTPGLYYATSDLNVRSKPSLAGKRIDHFKKGASVMVKKVMGKWCQIDYKKYRNAYVNCGFLKSRSAVKKTENTLTLKDFSLDYPKDWKTVSGQNMAIFYNNSTRRTQSISISLIETSTEQEAEKLLEQISSGIKSVDYLTVTSKEAIQFNVADQKVEATLISIDVKIDKEQLNHMMITTVRKGKAVYYVTGSLTAPTNDDKTEMQKIIKSFAIK